MQLATCSASSLRSGHASSRDTRGSSKQSLGEVAALKRLVDENGINRLQRVMRTASIRQAEMGENTASRKTTNAPVAETTKEPRFVPFHHDLDHLTETGRSQSNNPATAAIPRKNVTAIFCVCAGLDSQVARPG